MEKSEKSLFESYNFSPSNKLLVFAYEKLIHQTEKAFLLVMYGEQLWLPKKYATLVPRYKYLTIPAWLAGKRGFIKVLDVEGFNPTVDSSNGYIRKATILQWTRIAPPCTINFDPKTGGK